MKRIIKVFACLLLISFASANLSHAFVDNCPEKHQQERIVAPIYPWMMWTAIAFFSSFAISVTQEKMLSEIAEFTFLASSSSVVILWFYTIGTIAYFNTPLCKLDSKQAEAFGINNDERIAFNEAVPYLLRTFKQFDMLPLIEMPFSEEKLTTLFSKIEAAKVLGKFNYTLEVEAALLKLAQASLQSSSEFASPVNLEESVPASALAMNE